MENMFIFHTLYFLSARKSLLIEILTSQNNLYSGCIVEALVMQTNCRSKKGFLVEFQAIKQEQWNHETAQINLNFQRIVFGDDNDPLLPTLFFKAGDGQLR